MFHLLLLSLVRPHALCLFLLLSLLLKHVSHPENWQERLVSHPSLRFNMCERELIKYGQGTLGRPRISGDLLEMDLAFSDPYANE